MKYSLFPFSLQGEPSALAPLPVASHRTPTAGSSSPSIISLRAWAHHPPQVTMPPRAPRWRSPPLVSPSHRAAALCRRHQPKISRRHSLGHAAAINPRSHGATSLLLATAVAPSLRAGPCRQPPPPSSTTNVAVKLGESISYLSVSLGRWHVV